jgi:hypothetical protein
LCIDTFYSLFDRLCNSHLEQPSRNFPPEPEAKTGSSSVGNACGAILFQPHHQVEPVILKTRQRRFNDVE